MQKVIDISFEYLNHPLTTVAAIAKSMLKKVMQAQDKEQLQNVIKQIRQRAEVGGKGGGYKSRYLALNLMVDYISCPYEYLEQNPQTIKEIIESTLDTQQSGKYVLNFFEAMLKKALSGARGSGLGTVSSAENEKRWFDLWINHYLDAMLSSDNEALRDGVCTQITPIVIKINKNALPLILASLLSNGQSMQILEQVLTLLKIARQNKMLVIDGQELRLEPKA